MLDFWLKSCLSVSEREADFYSGCRKILRGRTLICPRSSNIDDLILKDCGYTKSKLSMLRRYYYVEESIRAANDLWQKRVSQGKYGSVGFTCYGHFAKGDVGGKTPRGSVMGPCIQSVVLTLLNKRETTIDVFYRTTELFKKFPADLVFLRDELLSRFDFSGAPVQEIKFHFANITAHPMYAVTFMPHLHDPLVWLESLKKKDRYFYDWTVKWTARYLCEEYSRGILKFSQALRVRKDALERIEKPVLKKLQKYLRDNHPGYRGDEEEDDDE